MITIKKKLCSMLFALYPKPFALCFLLTFCILNSTFYTATAEIHYVSHTGSSTPPYLTWEDAADSIQAAINVCSPGDTVIVENGIYYETIIVDREIALIGSSMDSTVIDGRGLSQNTTIRYNTNGFIENFHIYEQI